MKMLLTTIALVIASPAAAQTAAPAQSHDHHAVHGAQHGQGHADHAKHQPQSGDGHEGHHGECCKDMADGKMMDCCKKMKKEGKMPCCDHKEGKFEAGAHAGHDKH